MLFSFESLPALFIHIPKTGGNAIQQAIFKKGLSLDRMTITGHQDGVHRFGVTGKYTISKHMTIRQYYIHQQLHNLKIVTCIRRPLHRLISLYFSPHRLFTMKSNILDFDIDAFRHLVDSTKSCVQYLSISSTESLLLPPELITLRTEFLSFDSKEKLGLEIQDDINHSKNKDLQNSLLFDDRLAQIIKNSHHHLDDIFFFE